MFRVARPLGVVYVRPNCIFAAQQRSERKRGIPPPVYGIESRFYDFLGLVWSYSRTLCTSRNEHRRSGARHLSVAAALTVQPYPSCLTTVVVDDWKGQQRRRNFLHP